MKEFKIANHTMRYRDLGSGVPLIFLHGTPSSSEEFFPVMKNFENQFRVIAPDHLGFGFSDKPKDYHYSLADHAENFSHFIESLNIGKFHMIVHDFGGAIGLKYALKNKHKILSLTILNSWAWPFFSVESLPSLQRKIMSSGFMKFLYLKMNFSAKVLVKAGWGKYTPLTKEKHQIFIEKFKNSQDRLGTWSFAQALLNDKDPAWQMESELNQLSHLPIFILWGAADKLVTLKSYEQWKKIFPHAKTKVLEKVGHFIAYEAPNLVSKELQEFYS